MAYLGGTATNPQGDAVNTPISGISKILNTPIGANLSANTGWLDTSGYNGLLYVVRSNVPSANNGIVVEFSDDGVNPLQAGNGVTYGSGDVNTQVQRVLVPKARYTRITYTNGATAQTTFRLEVKLFTSLVQPTEGSLNIPMTSTALAMYVLAAMQLNNGSNVFDDIYRIGNAMQVYVTNPQQIPPTTGAIQNVTLVANVQQTIAANSNREGVVISSVSGTILISVGFTATATNWTYRIVTNGVAEIPALWSGLSISLFSTAAATVNVTLLT